MVRSATVYGADCADAAHICVLRQYYIVEGEWTTFPLRDYYCWM